MEPISGMVSGAVHSASATAGAKETPKVQRPEDEIQSCPAKPVMDKYVPEEQREPDGRYWLGKDENGKPKVYFDAPKQTADEPKKSDDVSDAESPDQNEKAKKPDKKVSCDKEERCTGSTDKVDREIEKLKKRQKELKQQLNSETDDTKIQKLKQKLAQVERELSLKDNDAYRRQHTVFS